MAMSETVGNCNHFKRVLLGKNRYITKTASYVGFSQALYFPSPLLVIQHLQKIVDTTTGEETPN